MKDSNLLTIYLFHMHVLLCIACTCTLLNESRKCETREDLFILPKTLTFVIHATTRK